MTLALLLTAVGGAWAQTETLLTTITPSGKDTYSETKRRKDTQSPNVCSNRMIKILSRLLHHHLQLLLMRMGTVYKMMIWMVSHRLKSMGL